MARATNLIFSGFISKQLPAGVTQEQAVEALRATGRRQARRHAGQHDDIRPGQGIDFAAVGKVLIIVVAIYLVSALLMWLRGLPDGRSHRPLHVPAARGRRPKAGPAAAEVLRQSRPRRHPQPGDQRHRQHPADHAADPRADHQLAF